jgi:molecular chaperone DnaK (HSP70)
VKTRELTEGSRSTILVFDLGGGTFDLSVVIVSLKDGHYLTEVCGIDGDDHLGGSNFTDDLLDALNTENDTVYEFASVDALKVANHEDLVKSKVPADEDA